MKNQALFSSKDKSNKTKMPSAAFFFVCALRVNISLFENALFRPFNSRYVKPPFHTVATQSCFQILPNFEVQIKKITFIKFLTALEKDV